MDGNEGAYRPNWFFLAPDECHKANYSGGENYHVALPDSAADFPIQGMSGVDELFVPYLRATLANGGFRGKIEMRRRGLLESRAGARADPGACSRPDADVKARRRR
jgi:hypothetical protein